MSKALFEINGCVKADRDGNVEFSPLSEFKLTEDVDKFSNDDEYANYLCEVFNGELLDGNRIKVGNTDGVQQVLLEGAVKLLNECGNMYYTMESIDQPTQEDQVEVIKESIDCVISGDATKCKDLIRSLFDNKLTNFVNNM